MGEGRTGPAGTCAPPRLCGERGRIFVAHTVRRYRGTGFGAGPRFRGGRGREAANIVRHGRSSGEGRTGPAGTCPRRGFAANGSAFCGARCAPLQGVRGWRRSAALRRTGPRFCGARCAPLQGTAGFGAGVRGITANRSAFCGARCAPLQVARVSAQGVQNAETVAANIVRHGRSMGEGRTGPAGTCAPLRLCGERVRIL